MALDGIINHHHDDNSIAVPYYDHDKRDKWYIIILLPYNYHEYYHKTIILL